VTQVASHAPEKIAPLLELRPWEKCGRLPYLPVCVGGCLGGKYLKTGRRDEVACKKEMFESSFRESVVQRYLAEFPAVNPQQHQGQEENAMKINRSKRKSVRAPVACSMIVHSPPVA